jgi:hypothetical protein
MNPLLIYPLDAFFLREAWVSRNMTDFSAGGASSDPAPLHVWRARAPSSRARKTVGNWCNKDVRRLVQAITAEMTMVAYRHGREHGTRRGD